jgi:hypothetical protein
MKNKGQTTVWWNGSAAGPRPKRRGPKRGESVGGVCPDGDEWLRAGKEGETVDDDRR